jgi:hypothetical protein
MLQAVTRVVAGARAGARCTNACHTIGMAAGLLGHAHRLPRWGATRLMTTTTVANPYLRNVAIIGEHLYAAAVQSELMLPSARGSRQD